MNDLFNFGTYYCRAVYYLDIGIKVISYRVVSEFVEREERGVVCMDDDGSSIDLEGEEECQSIDDEEEDIDDGEHDVDEVEGEEDFDEEDSGSLVLEEEDIEVY